MDRIGLIREKVATNGWFCTAVFPREEDEGVSFAYTSGFQQTVAQPDVVMVGFDPRMAHAILGSLYEGLKERGLTIPPEGGLLEKVVERFPVKLVPVPADMVSRFAYATVQFNGDEPTVMQQLLLPDVNGKFPGEPGVNPEYEKFQDIRLILEDPEDPAPEMN